MKPDKSTQMKQSWNQKCKSIENDPHEIGKKFETVPSNIKGTGMVLWTLDRTNKILPLIFMYYFEIPPKVRLKIC